MAKIYRADFWRSLSAAKIFFFLNQLFIGLIFFIGLNPQAFQSRPAVVDLAYYNGRSVALTGRVCEEADVDYKSRRLTVCISGAASGQVLVTTNLYPTYDYGDYLRIKGQLQAPPKISGFDYAGYLARYDIYSVMYYAQITRAVGHLTWLQSLYRALIRVKQYLKTIIDSNLPEPEAGLADALLLGYRRTIITADSQIFSRVGLSHMIAISGSHITILSALFLNFFLALGFSRRRALLFIFGFLFLYPLITGLAASAVRSAIMGGLAFLAIYYGRSSSLIRSLVFAAAFMLAFNPRLLRYDIGWQLSFLAILGILYIYPIGETWTRRFLDKLKLKRQAKNILSAILSTINLTLVSQLVILPVALINFKQLSLIAPVANVLVLWTFPLLLGSLLGGLAASLLIPAGGVIWFLPAYLLLKYIFVLSGWLAAPHWAAVAVNNFNWFGGGIYYGLLFIFVYLFRRQKTALD